MLDFYFILLPYIYNQTEMLGIAIAPCLILIIGKNASQSPFPHKATNGEGLKMPSPRYYSESTDEVPIATRGCEPSSRFSDCFSNLCYT